MSPTLSGSRIIPGVISSAEASAWSSLLTSAAGNLDADLGERKQLLDGVPGAGAGLRAGLAVAERLVNSALDTELSWLSAADTLTVCATLLLPLEKLYQRAIALLNAAGESLPLLDAILLDISTFGAALDWACSKTISGLCTPAPPAGGATLKDFDTLPSRAIHEVLYPQAPQEVQAILDCHPETHLLEVGPGLATIAIGDIDTADTITTLVMGVGSSNRSSWSEHYERAEAVARATQQPTVLWLGYRAPDSLIAGTARDPAHNAAYALDAFQTSLAARNPEAHRIVVGYSYGSVVVGSTHHLAADDIVLIGSPGASVSSAKELGQPHTEVHALTLPHDPIGAAASGRFGIHGVDPTSSTFGAEVWHSTHPGGHQGYWHDPEFLNQLGRLARKNTEKNLHSHE